jgi:hypothetical protein
MTIGYACEKMGQVVDALATGVGPVQHRLESAFHPPFWGAADDAKLEGYLPDDLLARIEALLERMTALDAGAEGQGMVSSTLNAMPDSEATEIASEMVEVAYRIWREGIKSGAYWWWTEDEP